jgi:hypothetical protein
MCFLAFPLEEYLVYVVIQVVGRIKSIECTRRQLCNLIWYVAVRISIYDRNHVALFMRIRFVICEFGIRKVPLIDNAWVFQLHIFWRLEIYIWSDSL